MALLDAGKPASDELDDRLEKLYRENVKITEEVQHALVRSLTLTCRLAWPQLTGDAPPAERAV